MNISFLVVEIEAANRLFINKVHKPYHAFNAIALRGINIPYNLKVN
jgi:hypothetical protein